MFAQANTFRSYIQNNARTNAVSLLEEYAHLTKEDIEAIKDDDKRASCLGLKKLLLPEGSWDEDKPTYPLIPPILSQGGTGKIEDLFRNPIHTKV